MFEPYVCKYNLIHFVELNLWVMRGFKNWTGSLRGLAYSSFGALRHVQNIGRWTYPGLVGHSLVQAILLIGSASGRCCTLFLRTQSSLCNKTTVSIHLRRRRIHTFVHQLASNSTLNSQIEGVRWHTRHTGIHDISGF